MNVLFQSPNTSKTITLSPSLTGTSPSVIHRYLECHPPSFPSDASWDILYPVPESSIPTFTRPPLAERSNLRKAALVWTRKELAEKETRYEERFKRLEGEIEAVKLLVNREHERHIHILRFETYSRLLQVLNDDLMSNLDTEVKLQMKKMNLNYITSILEGLYPHGPLELSPRDQLLHAATTTRVGQPIFSAFPDPTTKRMNLSHTVLKTMSEERFQLAVQLYYIIHEVRIGDGSQLLKTARNQYQHPRPSAHVAMRSLAVLVGEVPFDFDPSGIAKTLIEQEAMKDNVDSDDPQSSLFGQKDDPVMTELLKYL